jgi:hypothetical protein
MRVCCPATGEVTGALDEKPPWPFDVGEAVDAGTVTVRVVIRDPCPREIVTGKTETVAAGWVAVSTPGWLAGGVQAGQVSDGPTVIVKTAV